VVPAVVNAVDAVVLGSLRLNVDADDKPLAYVALNRPHKPAFVPHARRTENGLYVVNTSPAHVLHEPYDDVDVSPDTTLE